MKKAQSHYSLETLQKLYDKLLKTPSKKMSEPSKDETQKFKLGGKTNKKGDCMGPKYMCGGKHKK